MENEQQKEYELNTIQDIYEVVNLENFDRFMEDFKKGLSVIITLKETLKNMGLGCERIRETIENKKMVWKDDGKHDIEIELHQNIEEPKKSD